jgi:hypothetical protein
VAVREPSILAEGMDFQVTTMLVRDAVYVHGPIAALCSDKLVERVPRNALDEVVVLRNFMNALP